MAVIPVLAGAFAYLPAMDKDVEVLLFEDVPNVSKWLGFIHIRNLLPDLKLQFHTHTHTWILFDLSMVFHILSW